MLCYAFKTIDMKEQKKISKEEFDNANNLFAQILINSISFQLKRGIKKDYIKYEEQLLSPKGKIMFSNSISSGSIMRNKLVCEYEEMSENIITNQIIKTIDKNFKK
jgi:5-methylcytosine-specific restriction enzyme subunit McrC